MSLALHTESDVSEINVGNMIISVWCAVHGVRQGTACVHRFDSDGNIIIVPVVIEGANKTNSWFKSTAAHLKIKEE